MPKVWASYTFENGLRRQGYSIVAGADEVGRGALAGPLVAAVVCLPADCNLQVCDSKMVARAFRQRLAKKIKAQALAYSFGWVTNDEIDAVGLTNALSLAALRALEALELPISHLILDGKHNYLPEFDITSTLIKADQTAACVAAASILAKVERDTYMQSLHDKYPQYSFKTNVGYGTLAHRQALATHGLTDIHRKSFKIKSYA